MAIQKAQEVDHSHKFVPTKNTAKTSKTGTTKTIGQHLSSPKKSVITKSQTKEEAIQKKVNELWHSNILKIEERGVFEKMFTKNNYKVLFDVDAYKQTYGKEPTYGEISDMLGLKPGTLKEENGLGFHSGDMDRLNTTSLSDCKPSQLGEDPRVSIPVDQAKPYIDKAKKTPKKNKKLN